MKKLFFTLFTILIFSETFSQGNDVIIVNTNVIRTVEKAYRITENPKIIDTITPTPVIQYPLLTVQYPTSIKLDTIKAASIKGVDKLPQLYHAYVKVGIGSKLMPLGEVYFNNTRTRKYNYGFHGKHLSSFGNIKGYAPAQYDRSNFNLFGGINENKYTLKGDFHYNTKGFQYYGIQNDSLSRDSISQRYHDTGGEAFFHSHIKDSAHFNYAAGITYNNFLSKKPIVDSIKDWRTKENYFAILGRVNYKLGKELFNADLDVKYNGYQYGVADTSFSPIDTAIISNNTVISLKPNVTSYFQNNKFKAKVGFDVTLDIKNKTNAYVYPLVELKYSLFNDIFIPYVNLKGGLKQNTFRSITQVNEFVLPNLDFKNESTAFDVNVGFKGTISKTISFNLEGSYSQVKNKLLFVTDTMYSLRNKFNVAFDNGNIMKIEGNLSYQKNEKLKVDLIGRFFSYEMDSFIYAWNLPMYQFVGRGHYNLYDKFIVNLDFNVEGGRKALVYEKEKGVLEENNQLAKDLGVITDINLGIEYRYNTRISAFIQGNNLASQRYKRWYNTPVQGIQVMGGVTFRL